MGKLVHFRADGTKQEIRLNRERLTIGRRPDNDFCIQSPAVSGEHAAVVTILTDSFLEDLGSTNGTLVNGKAILKHFLRDRDEIDVGRQIIVYLADDAATIDAPPRQHKEKEQAAATETGSTASGAAREVTTALHRDSAVPVSAFAPEGTERTMVVSSRNASPAANAAIPRPMPANLPPSLKVLDGPRAGRILALTKSETLIGRAGVQVASLRRDRDAILVFPLEGTAPLKVNGAAVPESGTRLKSGDILEITGSHLELVLHGDAAV
jgi:predicted component of type VI protein secretion system